MPVRVIQLIPHRRFLQAGATEGSSTLMRFKSVFLMIAIPGGCPSVLE